MAQGFNVLGHFLTDINRPTLLARADEVIE